ncbi:calcyphosin protein isoform X1 [Biomphalaria glabrata]|uniref:EF-hand domain-containing protein n=1 Tax=Biomphalaria glabrata TaxID=6526 RepID=A0A2C9LM84_BIOGL|nr:calcyphosin protein isoform X1 [Biomphalaria glabrata]
MSVNSHTRASQKRSFATKSYERHLRASSASSETSLDLEDSVGSLNGLTITGSHEQQILKDVEIAQAQNDRVAVLIQRVRQTCLSKGSHGIQDLGIMFRHLDIDYNKRITFQELKDKLKDYGMSCSDIDLNILFCHLDKDGSGGIDFVELMEALRPTMKQCRIDVINEAFDIVDSGENGTIDMDEIRGN